MKICKQIVSGLLLSLLIIGCANSSWVAPRKIEEQKEDFHRVMEQESTKKHPEGTYQSLAYGDLMVYKPQSFIQLDSLYYLKKQFLDKNDQRGLRESGIEDLIPAYRRAAQDEIHLVQYEIEHLYQVTVEDSVTIYHDYFVFNYEDSLLSNNTFYQYTIPKAYQELYYAYQFNDHFVDDRDLYISPAEQEFIGLFKSREQQLIGEEELNSFMNHTFYIMGMAYKAQSIDFRNVVKWLVIDYFQKSGRDLTIEKVHPLYKVEEADVLLGYELEVEWTDDFVQVVKKSTFKFSPYLELEAVEVTNM